LASVSMRADSNSERLNRHQIKANANI
jgi:hypothetical protein